MDADQSPGGSGESSRFHTPVLCQHAVNLLVTDPRGLYVDGTVGGGGHARAICDALQPPGALICMDADDDALQAARRHLAQCGDMVRFARANFRDIASVLRHLGVSRIHGLLLDLGVSSYQLDEGAKGFSFRFDERLDMRMDRRQPLSARDVVNGYSERQLADLLWSYGEERAARRIARRIVAERPIETTGALAAAVEAAAGKAYLPRTLARVFQAIRIEVNGELESLARVLEASSDTLLPGGRLVVISYHSLEDRIVKLFFRRSAATAIRSGHALVPDRPVAPRFRVLTRKPLEPAEEEISRNPRARSAKLRAAERLQE